MFLTLRTGCACPRRTAPHRAPSHPSGSGWLVITPGGRPVRVFLTAAGDEAREEVAAARAAAEQRAREGVVRQRMAAFLAQQEPEPSP